MTSLLFFYWFSFTMLWAFAQCFKSANGTGTVCDKVVDNYIKSVDKES